MPIGLMRAINPIYIPSWIEMGFLRSGPMPKKTSKCQKCKSRKQKGKKAKWKFCICLCSTLCLFGLGLSWWEVGIQSDLLTKKQGSFCFLFFCFLLFCFSFSYFFYVLVRSWRNLTLNWQKKQIGGRNWLLHSLFLIILFSFHKIWLLKLYKKRYGQKSKARDGVAS